MLTTIKQDNYMSKDLLAALYNPVGVPGGEDGVMAERSTFKPPVQASFGALSGAKPEAPQPTMFPGKALDVVGGNVGGLVGKDLSETPEIIEEPTGKEKLSSEIGELIDDPYGKHVELEQKWDKVGADVSTALKTEGSIGDRARGAWEAWKNRKQYNNPNNL